MNGSFNLFPFLLLPFKTGNSFIKGSKLSVFEFCSSATALLKLLRCLAALLLQLAVRLFLHLGGLRFHYF